MATLDQESCPFWTQENVQGEDLSHMRAAPWARLLSLGYIAFHPPRLFASSPFPRVIVHVAGSGRRKMYALNEKLPNARPTATLYSGRWRTLAMSLAALLTVWLVSSHFRLHSSHVEEVVTPIVGPPFFSISFPSLDRVLTTDTQPDGAVTPSPPSHGDGPHHSDAHPILPDISAEDYQDGALPLVDLPTYEFRDSVAVIIEPFLQPNLVPVMLHFASVLGSTRSRWPVVLFTREESWTTPESIPFQRALRDQRIHVRPLPSDQDFKSRTAVSNFLAGPWLWERLASANRVLLFQLDSILCANANATVDDFLQYDMVGAPIAPHIGKGYNGGLSLRNPKLFLDVAKDPERQFINEAEEFEDQWFFVRLTEKGAHLPSADVAKTFAVETMYYERPLGYHQPTRWQKENMEQIGKWCPEVGMLTGARF